MPVDTGMSPVCQMNVNVAYLFLPLETGDTPMNNPTLAA